ncbi:MAG TPA: transposase [Gammaproteobacteria bacterium]|nr:transposase [Gammaproteobacteria bacterium]
MARMARVVVPGYPHHVTQRGNRRQTTFFCDEDYRYYVQLLSEYTKACGTEVWAYCLMPNHVHLVMVPQDEDGLRAPLAETHRRFTRSVNFREGWRGHLWQERFHSFVMDETHLLAATRYVECNPVAAGMCRSPQEWKWSSARAHTTGTDDSLVTVEPMLRRIRDWAAYLSNDAEGGQLGQIIERHSRTGRPLGDKAFVERLERVTGKALAPRRPGRRRARSHE